MSNMDAAKAAIEAELAHTREGLAFYSLRIEALEKTLSQLSGIASGLSYVPNVVDITPAKGKPKVGSAKPAKATESPLPTAEQPVKPAKAIKAPTKAKKQKGVKATGGNELPSTGKDFWPNLVTTEPKSASDILSAAIAGLGFKPTKAQVQKLAGRQTFAINSLVKTKAIQDSGKGRERRFFKA
jgi:hypothetical protein